MKMLATIKLSPHKYKTPEGYLICKDAILSRTGTQQYMRSEVFPESDSDEIIDVDRKAADVFDDAALASFENKPICIEHPDENVGPENYADLAVGHVTNIHKGNIDGQDVMLGDLLITDATAIEDIENGVRTDLSCGYDCDIEDDGQGNYSQINIRGNHIALCEQGRAGIARIQDSKKKTVKWIKPIQDSIAKGSLIQEFGKQGKQYKVSKIVNNVIYAESLETGKIVLFKKDEENIEWATITKAEVKDTSMHFNNNLNKKFEEVVEKSKETTKDSEDEQFNVFLKNMSDKDAKLYGEVFGLKMTKKKDGYLASHESQEQIEEFLKDYIGRWDLIGSIMNEGFYSTKDSNDVKILDKMTNRVIVRDPNAEKYDYFTLKIEQHKLYQHDGIVYNATSYRNDDWFKPDGSDNKFATYEEAENKAKEILDKLEIEDKEDEYSSADIHGMQGQSGNEIAYINSYDTGRLSPKIKKQVIKDTWSQETFNGYLQDLDIEELVLRMKKRGEAINSVRVAPNGKIIVIFIYGHGEIEHPRDLYVSIIEEDRNETNQERIFSKEFKTYEDLIADVEKWKHDYINNIIKKEYTGDAAALDPRIIETIHDVLGEDVKIDFGVRGQNIVIRYPEKITSYMAKANLTRLISALKKLGIKVDEQSTIEHSNIYAIEVWHNSNLSWGDIREWTDSIDKEEEVLFYKKAVKHLEKKLKELNKKDDDYDELAEQIEKQIDKYNSKIKKEEE